MALIYSDLAGTVVTHPDLDVDVRILEFLERALRPFDELHPRSGQHFRDPDLQPFAAVLRQPIGVDVDDRWAALARVLVNDGERGRRDLERIGAQLRGDGPCEKGLARAEVADEMNDGVGWEGAGDLATGGVGFGFGCRHELHAPRTF